MFMKRDNRTRGGGIRILVEDCWRLFGGRIAPEHLARNQVIHVLVRLMEPDALEVIRIDTEGLKLGSDLFSYCRAHLLEDLSSLLHK